MLNETTVTKLHEMKLSTMAQAFRDQTKDSNFSNMSFEERFGMLVDIEWSNRKSNRLIRLIKKADYAFNDACRRCINFCVWDAGNTP
ncbi:IstB-like ATP binding protein, partial [Ruminiclostridium sufflavum DSM 19573]